MTKEEQLHISLMVIKLGGRFANTYGLCRFIDLKFDIFDCTNIINDLIAKDYVTYNEIDGGRMFYLNSKGEEVLKNQKIAIIELLKHEFPKELFLAEIL